MKSKQVKHINIGWLHKSSGTFQLVSSRKGGGTRSIECDKDEPITVESITELGKKLFFANGNSSYGNLEDMNVELGTRNGETITKFTDLKDEDCSYQEYLKAHGFYPSKFYIYLKTELKDSATGTLANMRSFEENIKNVQSSEEELENVPTSNLSNLKTIQSTEFATENSTAKSQVLVDGNVPHQISVKYKKRLWSAYSSDISYLTNLFKILERGLFMFAFKIS